MNSQSYNRPSKAALIREYHNLDSIHPHHLLRLETKLPSELRHESRDGYRIIMTMILSQRIDDKRLTEGLGTLFNNKMYPNFASLRYLQKSQISPLLGGIGFGFNDPDRGGNGGRLWSLLCCYFGDWNGTITGRNIQELRDRKHGRGFGPAFVRKLEAYYLGNSQVLPLDTPAFRALQTMGLYKHETDVNEVRKDIEDKLRGEPGVSLIDFHEMLRFKEQTRGKSAQERHDIIIGWNAWRLLCSKRREAITKDWKWIHENLVEHENIAQSIWKFYHKVANCSSLL